MKKPRRPMGWEDNDEVSFDEGGSEMNDLLDDEIIDLDDIVELPEGELEDDDRMDVDVEVLDLDSDLDFGEERGGADRRKKGISESDLEDESAFSAEEYSMSDLDQEGDSLDDETDELLKDFAFADEEGERPQAVAALDLMGEEPDESSGGSLVSGGSRVESDMPSAEGFPGEAMIEELEELSPPEYDNDMEPRESLDLPAGENKEAVADVMDLGMPGEEPAEAALKGSESLSAEGEDLMDLDSLLNAEIGGPAEEELQTVVAAFDKAGRPDSGLPVDAPGVAKESVDELVSRIEARLLASVREIVEARLPDVVRAVLNEEIEKIKKDMR
jgi:hypothetical protein